MMEGCSKKNQRNRNESFDFTSPSSSTDSGEDSPHSLLRKKSLLAIESKSSYEESQLPQTKSFCCSSSQKVSNAAVSIPPIDHVSYVHGAYAAVAPLFVEDPFWMEALQLLMPEAHNQVTKLLKVKHSFGDSSYTLRTASSLASLMKWAQHNPVVAAYGVLQGYPYRPSPQATALANSRARSKVPNTTPIEWDVFLDPYLVLEIEKEMQTQKQPQLDKLLTSLITRMLLSHGSVSQLMAEALGVAPKFNFSKLAAQARTATSAFFLTTWLHLFLSALRHGKQRQGWNDGSETTNDARGYDSRTSFDLVVEYKEQNLIFNNSCCGLLLCTEKEDFVPERVQDNSVSDTLKRTLNDIKAVLGKPLRVVLDLKSRHVPPRVWARLIEKLFSYGLSIHGVGSFDLEEVRAIVRECTASSSIVPMIFFHSAGDLQRACHANKIKKGDNVYFNGGSLLWQRPSVLKFATARASCLICSGRGAGKDQLYSVNDELLTPFSILPFAHPRASLDMSPEIMSSSLEDYKQFYNLSIGLYVQEFSICHEALEILTNFVNFYSDIYNLGFAYGGLNGAAVDFLYGDGFWNQRYIGRNWDSKCSGPTGYLEPDFVEDNELIQEAIVAGGAIGALYFEEDESAHASLASCLTSDQRSYDYAHRGASGDNLEFNCGLT